MPYAMVSGGSTYYLAYDQVGSLRLITDTSGHTVKQIDYDSFGNILVDSNSSFTIPFGFAGGLHDRDTNLVRFGYRDYSPELGRWTAKDPILFAGGDTNLYGYVSNDPVNWVDPEGLFSWGFGGTVGPLTVSWDSSNPTKTNLSLTSDLEIGGGISLTFDHPFEDSNPTKSPVDFNIGPSRWLGFSTDGTKLSVKLGLGAGLTPIDISKGGYFPEDDCP